MDPVFIVGCQRSGTTFLGSLLGADPATIAIPEAQFVADFAETDPAAVGPLAPVVDRFAGHERFRIWNFDLQGARPEGSGTYADAVRWLVRRYAAAQGKPDAIRWIDHQPGHVRAMAELRGHFPTLKAVHIVRDGRAVAASVMPLAWGPNAVQSAANFWAQRVAMGMALRDYLGADTVAQVRYEDILADPEGELRRLCEFLGVPFTPAMTEGGGFKVPAFTANQHGLVGRRPDKSRSASWRKSLSPREIEMFEALVGPLLTYLGYPRDHGQEARLPSFGEKMRMTFADQTQALRNRRIFAGRVRAFSR